VVAVDQQKQACVQGLQLVEYGEEKEGGEEKGRGLP
jgi:hypothetical protein